VTAVAEPLTLELPEELVEAIVQRVLERLADRDRQEHGRTEVWLRGAQAIAEYIGAPRSRVYGLTAAGRIPVHRDGSALLARRDELDAWIQTGGGRRP
jgi:excisionase family DNA binding protein